MLRVAGLVASILLLPGCYLSAPKDAKQVLQVLSDLKGYDGKDVIMVGWLGPCGYYDCAVYQSLEDAKTVEREDHRTDAWSQAMDRRLNLCMAHDDKQMLDLTSSFTKVIVKGRLDATCKLGAKNKTIFCFDGCDFETDSVERIVF